MGAAMRAAREAHGIGLRQMAKRLGYSAHSNLSDYESGKRLPSERVLGDYERVLELEPGSLTTKLESRLDQLAISPSLVTISAPDPSPTAANVNVSPINAARPTPRTRRPSWMIVGFVAITSAILGAAVTFLFVTATPPSVPSRPPGAALYPDGSDPDAMGCASDAAKPDRVNVYDPPQHLVGTLELVSSPRCGMSWGRFVPTVALTRSPTVRIHIDMHRPSDGATAPFAVDFDGQPDYGNMLASREECVYATVTLVRNGESTVPFATGCFRAP